MEKGMTIAYRAGKNLYVNLTNRCSSACIFCIRQRSEGVGEADSLWLQHEPTVEEAKAAISAFDTADYDQLVFCGYGEPTEALDVLLAVAAWAKPALGKSIRVDTNGQGSLIAGYDIVPKLAGVVDAVSVSLNAPTADRYQEVTQSEFGPKAFDAMLEFTREAKAAGLAVTMTTVGTMLTQEEEAECARMCKEMGVRYRVRTFV